MEGTYKMRMEGKMILDLGGGTGLGGKPYKIAGYEVINVTLPDYDVREYIPPDNVHGVLAAPPCTEFSFAKHVHGKGNYEHNFREGLEIVSACMRIILTTRPKWWALENPKGYLQKFIGPPVFMFEPWQYGDNYQKRTCLWGDFNAPQPTTKNKPDGLKKFTRLRTKEIYPEYYGKLSRTERRAITPPGFAKAFFEANR